MNPAFLLVSGALVLVALAGTVLPLTRPRVPLVQQLSDPLEDERDALLRALRELEEDRASGSLREEDYRSLRVATERRAVAVLKALGEQTRAELRGALGGTADGQAAEHSLHRPRRVAAILVGVLLLVSLVPLLAGSLRSRTSDQPITGGVLGPGASANDSDPLAFFVQRVEQNPSDVAARLDLAYRYLNTGQIQAAVTQYEAALQLDPNNAEAHAYLGLVLHLVRHDEEALNQVDEALSLEPGYPEALFIRGLILLKGLHRYAAARTALKAYLRAAPFGSERQAAERLLRSTDRGDA